MDTRAPPICPRQQDNRCQQSNKIKQQHQQQEVTLPPLDPYPAQRQKSKQSCWRSASAAPPGLLRQHEIQRRRPYRVLALGATPLMHACQQGDRQRVLKLLREQEETVGYRDRALRSALHYCMDAGTGGAVAQVAPELVDSPDADGHTALHLAVIGGDSQLVAVLLANGANVNALDLQGHSVLHWAVVCGEVECVRLVLAAGARPSIADHRGGTALHYAAQCCGAPASSELAVPKKSGLAVLHALLEYGADVHARDEDGRQPVLWAASAGSPDAILALVRVGGSAVSGSSDKDGLTALHCAASRGHARCIETLVNLCDAQPDHVDDNGCSALHYAATLGHADATSLLLRLGADPNRQDRKGRTPALCAAAKGQLETLKILAQHGGSLHARTIRGTGLAHEAVASGRLELVRWLARRRPGLLDVATPDGRTPLHVAALHGHLDVCKLLLDSGARVNALLRTSKGTLMTALDAALYRGHRDAAKLVQMHGGLTAQHIAARKPGHNRVFAAKLRARPSETSSDDSERKPSAVAEHSHQNDKNVNSNERTTRVSNAARRQKQDAREAGSGDVYYEERWVERRTRRRAKARRLTRHDSRSFSEEELRRGTEIASSKPNKDKAAKQEQQQREQQPEHKRALSEGAGRRLDDDGATGSTSRKGDEVQSEGKMGEASESRSEAASTRSDDEYNEDEAEEGEEDSSVSDDSLEIVVVRRSLEKTSERIVSGRTRTRTHLETSSSKDTNKDPPKRTKRSSKRERKPSKQQQEAKGPGRDNGDNTSQEQEAERVTVTADVHERRQSKESPGDDGAPEPPSTRSKIDEMLEKADELQSALMSQAADLRKDMEQLRLQEQVGVSASGTEASTEETNKSEASSSAVNSARDANSSRAENAEKKEDQTVQEKEEEQKVQEKSETEVLEKDGVVGKGVSSQEATQRQQTVILVTDETDSTSRIDVDEPGNVAQTEKQEEVAKTTTTTRKSSKEEERPLPTAKTNKESTARADTQGDATETQTETSMPGTEAFRYVDESSSSSPRPARRTSRPSTAKQQQQKRRNSKTTAALFESSEDASPDRSAIVAVIESPEWDEDEEDELDKEIRRVVGEYPEEHDEDEGDGNDESDGGTGIVRVLPNTSDDELPDRTSTLESLPQLQHHNKRVSLKRNSRQYQQQQQQQQQLQEVDSNGGGVVGVRLRRDSNGRDSGIEPSPRVHQSRIPRRSARCCPNSERQQALNMDTVTRDLQISMRRYHLERKIFFQLMELKRLQIRHGRSNEHVLIKRQVDSFHKAGMSGPALGVARYDQPFTFRHFESFLYEQLRRLQRRSATPDWCTEAKQCTQKTHRCHHATSAYTSVPIYTYLGGGGQERSNYLPNIEGRGKGQMTVKLTHGQEKQIIALPTEKLDRTKRYYVTFTVRGDTADNEKPKTPCDAPTKRQPKNT